MTIDRRDTLRWALRISAFGLVGLLPAPLAAMVKPGMRTMRGDVQINGRTASASQIVNPGDRLTTGPGAEATLISGFNAYLLRGDGDIVFPEDNAAQKVLRVISGQLISVFGPGAQSIDMPLATIGIRGTGIYVEAWADRNYVCLCYGRAVLKSKLNPAVREGLSTFHHNTPRTVHRHPDRHGGLFIEPAEMVNHQDEELILLEALVGRVPLFGPKPIKMPKKE